MNLAVKYRARNFNEIVGQEHIKKTIMASLKKNAPSHAFLFSGGRGTGKTSIARILAKAINCQNLKEGNPCNECKMCISANEGKLVDIIEIDAASHTSVDNVREIIEKTQFQPSVAKNKVHIIDEVHMLSKSAFNALLKTLEEPPSHAYFILATTERHKIPDTIQSRCQSFNFRNFQAKEIIGRLEEICDKESISAEPDALKMLAHEALGGMRDAIFLLEQYSGEGKLEASVLSHEMGLTPHTALEKLYQYIETCDALSAINHISSLASEGLSLSNFAKSFIYYLRDLLLIKIKENDTNAVNKLLKQIEAFRKAYLDLKNATIPTLPLELAVAYCIFEDSSTESAKEDKSWSIFTPTKKKEPEIIKKPDLVKQEAKEVKKPLEPKKKAVFNALELTLDNIHQNWPKIISKVTPSIRMILKSSSVKDLKNREIVIACSSKMYKNKLDNSRSQADLQKAFEDIFSLPVKINTVVETVSLEPVVDDDSRSLDGEELEKAVMEILGGKKNE